MLGLALAFLSVLGWGTFSVFPSTASADPDVGGGSTHPGVGSHPCEGYHDCGHNPHTTEPSETTEPFETTDPPETTEPSETSEPSTPPAPQVVVPPYGHLPSDPVPNITRPDTSSDPESGDGGVAVGVPPASGSGPEGPGPGTSPGGPQGPPAADAPPHSNGTSLPGDAAEGNAPAQDPVRPDVRPAPAAVPDSAPPAVAPVVHSEPLPAFAVLGGVGLLLGCAGGAGVLTFKGARAQEARIAAARAEFFPPAPTGGM
ncbi:cell surface protein [Rhodococcus sp. ZPP]|nr:cell surface protein [Rhodococcus sp. ZPP]